jgi:sulfur carrier protein ThiS adenylyltransferase
VDARYSRLLRSTALSDTLERWQRSTVAVIGCGGLGGGLVQALARMGVASIGGARLVLIDRDTVDAENLGHQGLPKAIAGAQVVGQINSDVQTEPVFDSLNRQNIQELLRHASLLFDGLDSYGTRLLVNDYALTTNTPYFYTGVVRGELSARAVVPGVTGCLHCLLGDAPPAGSVPTCAAEGVFPPLLGMANLLQLAAANKVLAGEFGRDDDVLYSFNLDTMALRSVKLSGPSRDCAACQGRFDYLDGNASSDGAGTCAPDSCEAQLPLSSEPADLHRINHVLAQGKGFELRLNPWCLTAQKSDCRYTIFPSGKVVLTGSSDGVMLDRFIATYLGV